MCTPPIDSFPKDDVRRVVWASGPIFPNTSLGTAPLVEVALREILPSGELNSQAIVVKIAVAQIDIARKYTIWKGQNKTTSIWTLDENGKQTKKYSEQELFNFNFNVRAAESIKFCDRNSRTGYGYIPPFIYSLKSIPVEGGCYYRFFNSTLTKLITTNDITVLIPSIEFYTSTYTPREQQIRNQLLLEPVANVLDRYLNINETYINSKGSYVVSLKNMKHKTNVAFLAFLALNKVSRNNVNKIRTSVLKTHRNKDGDEYPEKYLDVLPYHPEKMQLKCAGIWIDDYTFFVDRINGCSLPDEYKIICTSTEYVKKTTDEVASGESVISYDKKVLNHEVMPISNHSDPHADSGALYISSDVKVIDNEFHIQEVLVTEFEKSKRLNIKTEDVTIESLSSGDAHYGKESESTAQLRQTEQSKKESRVDQTSVLHFVRMALDKLPMLNNNVKAIEYLSWDAKKLTDGCYTSFPHSLHGKFDSHSWIEYSRTKDNQSYIPRSLLIVRVILNNNKKAYLLEIERKSKNEGFSGLVFNVEGSLTKDKLVNLLSTIVKHKGKYRRRTGSRNSQNKSIKNKLPVLHHVLFDHQVGSARWTDKILRVLYQSINEGVFKDDNEYES